MNERERNDLIISWATISLAFAFLFSNGVLGVGKLIAVLPLTMLASATGFVLHELAHKYVAIHFKAIAEFRMWTYGLAAALVIPIISFGMFFFAAPGAVYIYGPHITRKQNALISLAGPATNIVIALFSLGLAPFISINYLKYAFYVNFVVNSGLAFFNLLPIPPLDGSKIVSWNPLLWLAFAALAFFLSFVFQFSLHMTA